MKKVKKLPKVFPSCAKKLRDAMDEKPYTWTEKTRLPKVRPCPSGHTVGIMIDTDHMMMTTYRVCCYGNDIPRACWLGPYKDTQREAILAWNKRA